MDGILFVRKIESMLAAKGKPKEEFYKESGITSAAMSQYRSGLYNPSKRTISKAAAYFGLSVEDLTEQKEPPWPETEAEDPLDREIFEHISKLSPAKKVLVLEKVMEIEKF